MPSLDMDFEVLDTAAKPAPAAVPELPPIATTEAAGPAADHDRTADDLHFDATQTLKAAGKPEAAAAPAAMDEGMIEFDLGALSLDLDSPAPPAPPPVAPPAAAAQAQSEPAHEEAVDSTAGAPLNTGGLEYDDSTDPLATKLALAQEFNAIGDPDGARSLAEEVLAEASGDLKQKAQRFLAEIA
jgi:pilus assembly protein FimV